MPRIIRILNRLAVGGPVLNATYLTRYLAPEFETLLVVGEKEDHEQSASYLTDKLGISYHTIPEMGRSVSPIQDYKAYQSLKSLIRQFRPDIIHTHAAKPGALGRMAAAACGVPVVLHTFHGHVFHSYFNPVKTKAFVQVERFLARRTDAIVTISEQQRMELSTDFRIAPPDKFHVIPLGFDLDRFQEDQSQKRSQFRSEFGIADDEVAIGIIGRLVPVKNHELFLQGLRHVLDHTTKKVKAFIVGGGDMRERLEAICNELGIAFNTEKDSSFPHPLTFTSWRNDIDTINAGLDIVALTSFNEGTPVSLIEAQAANRPVVSTRVGGIADIVAEGRTGLLSDLADKAAFGANLLRLVEEEGLRHELGSNGNAMVKQQFSYQRLVSDMSRLYHKLLHQKGN